MDDNQQRMILHKICIINNDIKIMKDTIFDMKIEMNEMKKLLEDIILFNQKKDNVEKNYWFYK